jgi:transposase
LDHTNNKIPWKIDAGHYNLRKRVAKANKLLIDPSELWQAKIPFATRDYAVKNACTAYKACLTNKRVGNISRFELRYMSRHRHTHIFWVVNRALKTRNSKWYIFVDTLRNDSWLRFKRSAMAKMPEEITSNAKVLLDRGAYYLVLSFEQEAVTARETDDKMIALDPGVRTFQTGYSPSGTVFQAGENQRRQIDRLHKRIDLLRSDAGKSLKTIIPPTEWDLKG